MKVNHTLSAIFSSHWFLAESAVAGYAEMADLYIQNKLPSVNHPSAMSLLEYVAAVDYADANAYDNVPKLLDNGILIFPIMGIMMQQDNCWTAGTMTMTNWVEKAKTDPAVKSILFVINSPGGQAPGTWELATTIRDFSSLKYSETFAMGYLCSAAMYVASGTNKITASSPDVMVGSIGVAWGYRPNADGVKYVYASTSTKKHAASRAVREQNDPTLLQELELNPMDKTFMDFAKAQRPDISQDALDGLEVVASKSLELNAGIIDGIDSFQNVLAEMALINSTQKMSDNKTKVKMLVPTGYISTAIKHIGAEEITAAMEAEEVAGLNLQLATKDNQVATLTAQLQTEKDAVLALQGNFTALQSEKANLETEKANLTQAVADKDAEIVALTAKIAEYEKPGGKPNTGPIETIENDVEKEDAGDQGLPGYKKLFKEK